MTSEEDISVAVLYPGNRAEKMTVPLETTDMDVAVEPDDAYDRDIVVADNADRDLGKEVLKKPFHGAELIYRMRGDVFHELDLWDMHPIKEWIARYVVLRNVDGAIAVSDRLAEKFADVTGNGTVGSAGLWKRPDEWPDVEHTDHELRIATLTNANYWKKVSPILDAAPVVDDVLRDVGGYWRVGADGEHARRLAGGLEAYDFVEFAGFVDPKHELGRSNLMLHPSNLDGQPNSILEGMASRLPVITNDFEAFTRFDGPLETYTSGQNLSATLYEYVDPAARETLARESEKYVGYHHSPAYIGQQYVDFFTEVLSG